MKSYVTLEQNICVVCGHPFDTGALLLDRRLRDRFEHKTISGWGMCPDDSAKKAEGYVALVGVKNNAIDSNIQPGDADRTGVIIHVRKEVFSKIFNADAPAKGVAFIDQQTVDYLTKLNEGATDAEG